MGKGSGVEVEEEEEEENWTFFSSFGWVGGKRGRRWMNVCICGYEKQTSLMLTVHA